MCLRWRWGSCWGLPDPALVCLHSTGRSWQPGNLESVTFKIHFVILVNKKWQTEESWKKMIHSCADSWEQLWPGSKASWVDQKLCYGMTGLALQVLQLEAACGRRGTPIARQPLLYLSFQECPPFPEFWQTSWLSALTFPLVENCYLLKLTLDPRWSRGGFKHMTYSLLNGSLAFMFVRRQNGSRSC